MTNQHEPRRLNDAQTKTRKSVADSNASATSDSNSGNMDSNAAMVSTPGNSTADKLLMDKQSTGPAAGSGAAGGGGGGGSSSPQMPRSGSGISVKSRRSIPSQKSASRTSVDEPGGMAAELHDLPEGSESGDSETATEVDVSGPTSRRKAKPQSNQTFPLMQVAEKTSKFKVDTEGCSNRSKSSHSTSRKSSREKRPSMIGELCSSGGGQRMRNSYGNIHGYHANRCQFGSNRAVSLDQYSTNNRRLSDGLPQVISDSNVFYGRHNRNSLEQQLAQRAAGRAAEDLNMNTSNNQAPVAPVLQQPLLQQSLLPTAQQLQQLQQQQQQEKDKDKLPATAAPTAATTTAAATGAAATTNGNISPTLNQTLASNGSAATATAPATATVADDQQQQQQQPQQPGGSNSSSSWKSRLRQFSDYFTFSFDKGNKRFGSTRSSPCAVRGNNNAPANDSSSNNTDNNSADKVQVTATCCTISNSLPSPGVQTVGPGMAVGVARHRAYSLDVPCSRHAATRYSSADSSSRKSSRHDEHNNSNNSNNTLHSGSGIIGELSGVRIRIGSAEDGGSEYAAGAVDAAGGVAGDAGSVVIEPPRLLPPSISCELGLASGSSSEAVPKI